MSKRDLKSDVKVLKGLFAEISSNTTTTGSIIDTKDFVNLTLIISSVIWADGTYTPTVYEDTESDMSTESAIADGKLIPQTGGEAALIMTAADEVHTLGIIDFERYVRVKVASSGTSSGATIVALWIAEKEVKEVSQG